MKTARDSRHSAADWNACCSRHDINYLFHFTHVANVASIARHGLLSHTSARAHRIKDISDPEVQSRRAHKADGVHGRPLHDYVPLYFRARNPMLFILFKRRKLQPDLAVLYIRAAVFDAPGVVFTDGNAAADATKFFSQPGDFSRIDWECLRAESWVDFPDGKRKRCAEVLVPEKIDISLVDRIVVYNQSAEEKVRNALVAARRNIKVLVRPKYFFS